MLNARRIVLDEILLDAALEAGAEGRTGTSVTGLLESDGRVAGVETTAGPLRAPLVVGADGARSTVARLAGARNYVERPASRVFLWAYFEGAAGDSKLWLGAQGDRSYLACPTDSGLFLAAVVEPIARHGEMRAERDRVYADGIAAWPELAEHLSGATQVGPVRTMGNWSNFFRESAGPGWALLGDAGHFKDPTPGQGIADALRQGEAMAAAIEAAEGDPAALDGALRRWWKWRDEDAWEMFWFAQDISSTELSPLLGRAMQMRLAADSELIESFLRILNHEIPPSEVFTARVIAPVVGRAFREGRGQRRALARELGDLAVEEFRRRGPPRAPLRGH
jgi:2-polyprenyl-6-methoxyphenol hydroxylase-like FAD-dependent oxidoreductase